MKRFENQLRITEIFHSLQGESSLTGLPTVFIRLTGCPLRCQYCDTAYAFSGGSLMSLDEILAKTHLFNTPYVCVTGGEPLAQPACLILLKTLSDAGFKVSLETSGARDIAQVDPRVHIVMDLKTPDSMEEDKNLLKNLEFLKPEDEIKFVLCSLKDYDWAKRMIETHRLDKLCKLLFSPSWKELKPQQLADWIVADQLPVRFQLQLHKILWNDAPGH